MKSIKYIILSIAIALGFLLQCEIFQNEVWNFDKAYYQTSHYHVAENEMGIFLQDVKNVSKREHVNVFSTSITEKSNYESELHVYGNEKNIRKVLSKKNNIIEKQYTSLFTGTTNVIFYSFLEQKKDREPYISFAGSTGNIEKVYKQLSKKYELTKPDYLESTEKDMVMIVWTIIVLLMVALTCIDIIRRKKEIVIRISLGESVWKIIGKSILSDFSFYVLIYFCVHRFVFYFVSGEFQWKLALFIYLLGALISCTLYFTFAFYDMKKAFSNVQDTKAVLYLLYGLKIAVTILSIFTITTNISSIQNNIVVHNESTVVDEIEQLSYLKIRDLQTVDSLEDRDKIVHDIWTKMDSKDGIEPHVCINILQDQSDYIFLSQNGMNLLQGFANKMSKNDLHGDLIIFIPKNVDTKNNRENAIEAATSFINEKETSIQIQYISYASRENFTYISSEGSYGMETAHNPILIYQNSDKVTLKTEALIEYAEDEMLYQISDDQKRYIETKYHLSEQGFELVKTKVKDFYEYRKSFMVRLISFCSSLCVVIFILQLILIFAINSMEYRIHALELALYKVLGYGIWYKNRKILLCSVGIDIFLTATFCISSFFIEFLSMPICMLVGVVMTGVELLVVVGNIMQKEKGCIAKALKGGCL